MIAFTAEFRAGLADRSIAKTALVEMTYAGGVNRLWSGVGQVQWNGQTWQGLGDLASISEIQDDDQVAVSDLVFQLAGVDPERLKLLNTNVKGQTAKVWFALVRPDRSVIADPVRIRTANLDVVTQNINESLQATLTVTAQADLWKSDQPGRAAFTPEEQKATYPDDTGFDLVGTTAVGSWKR